MKNKSILFYLNYLFIQWFFTRLYFKHDHYGDYIGWGFMKPVFPLSGYNGKPYKYVFND